jgi:hypothetical protein
MFNPFPHKTHELKKYKSATGMYLLSVVTRRYSWFMTPAREAEEVYVYPVIGNGTRTVGRSYVYYFYRPSKTELLESVEDEGLLCFLTDKIQAVWDDEQKAEGKKTRAAFQKAVGDAIKDTKLPWNDIPV